MDAPSPHPARRRDDEARALPAGLVASLERDAVAHEAAMARSWRRVMAVVLPMGALAFAVGALLEGPSGRGLAFDQVTYPVMAVLLVLAALAVVRVPRWLPHVLSLAVVVGTTFLLGKLGLLLFAAPAGIDVIGQMMETFFWLPAVYLLAFLAPGHRLSRVGAMAVTGSMLLLSGAFLLVGNGAGAPRGLDYALAELNLANGVFAVLTFALIRFKEAYAHSSAERRLAQRVAHQDLLTGLPNRRALEQALEERVAATHAARLAVLLIDVDGFKVINDSLGHAAGDTLLQLVADRLRGAMRDGDLVARMSGDEFVVLARDLGRRGDAGPIAQRVVGALSLPFSLNGSELSLTCSIGVAYYPDDAEDAVTLLRHADSAMYRVKRSGKNGVKVYSPDSELALERRGELERDLREAIAERQFELHFQPAFDLRDGTLRHLEALLRWRHPRLGMVGPAEFVPLAEESGSIVALGGWALEEACRRLAMWRVGAPELRVSVNVSPLQFTQPTFFGSVVRALQEAGLPASALQLELRETLLAGRVEDVVGTLRGLRGLGVRIAIDDFGTGFSSLAYLRDLPVDAVKIDGSVVRDMVIEGGPTQRYALAIMEAILGLARHLDLDIVAEGVEVEAQRDRLMALGCHLGQGYLFARPVPPEAVADMLMLAEAGNAPRGVN